MKILCITSSEPGHMDFGGKGFVDLGNKLHCRGHDVSWLSFGLQVERLQKAGCVAETLFAISGLSLMPFFHAEDINLNKQQHQFRIDSIREIYSLLNNERPDVLIIDRLLTYVALVAEQLNIPYIAIGTPGGYWYFEKNNQGVNVFPITKPVDSYHIYGECLKKELAWNKGYINSFCVHSPQLNICFMNRDFYPISNVHKKISANVNHHQELSSTEKGRRIGISFGNQGNQQLLFKFLQQAVTLSDVVLPIDVFVGDNEETYHKLDSIYRSDQIILHRWVDFTKHLPGLSCLVFLGGIGTIWQCINCRLPMLIVSGNVGDQRFNAERVQVLGLGIHLDESDLNQDKLATAITQCCENSVYTEQIDKFRSPHHYTDTLDSICDRIENLQG